MSFVERKRLYKGRSPYYTHIGKINISRLKNLKRHVVAKITVCSVNFAKNPLFTQWQSNHNKAKS